MDTKKKAYIRPQQAVFDLSIDSPIMVGSSLSATMALPGFGGSTTTASSRRGSSYEEEDDDY